MNIPGQTSDFGWCYKALYKGLLCLIVALTSSLSALAQPDADGREVLQVFVQTGCPHCADARDYLEEFSRRHPDLEIVYRMVDSDLSAREELTDLAKVTGQEAGVPAFAFKGRLLVGFSSPALIEPYLIALLERRELTPQSIETGIFGPLSIDRLGLPLFTLAIGLLDGFNPCAMWVLLFLLSMLVHLQNRKRMALVAGVFVLASGAVYYAFMAAWLNLFIIVGMSYGLRIILSIIAVTIGLINTFEGLVSGDRFTLSIPASARPGIYRRVRDIIRADSLILSLVGVTTLAILVNLVELLCTAGFPSIYTAILTQQGLEPLAYYAYLALYILGYITDDTVMVIMAVLAFSSHKLGAGGGRFLKLLSGLVMLVLGLILFIKPGWLY